MTEEIIQQRLEQVRDRVRDHSAHQVNRRVIQRTSASVRTKTEIEVERELLRSVLEGGHGPASRERLAAGRAREPLGAT